MSNVLFAVLIAIIGFAAAYVVCEWVLRRRERGGSNDSATR